MCKASCKFQGAFILMFLGSEKHFTLLLRFSARITFTQ